MTTLDGRDVPSAYTPYLPAAPEGEPTPTTSVAVAQMVNADGTDSDVYMLVEKSDQTCTIQFYDGGTNTIYTATNSATTAFTMPSDAGMDEAFTVLSVAGGLDALRFEQTDGTLVDAASIVAGAPPALAARVAVAVAAAPPGATEILIGEPLFIWNDPKPPSPITGGGTSFSGRIDLLNVKTDHVRIFAGTAATVTIPQNIFGQPASGSIVFQAGIEIKF